MPSVELCLHKHKQSTSQSSLIKLSIKTHDKDNLLSVVTLCQDIYLEEAAQSLWK